MGRLAATVALTIQRGSTWEDDFTYTDEDGVGVDLTGYKARLQVRTLLGRYGTTTEDTLLLEKNSEDDATEVLFVENADEVLCVLRLKIPVDDVAALNPDNEKKVKVAFGIELFKDSESPEYVIPLCDGTLVVRGEVVR
jgi:hypothetical protein